MKHPTTTDLLLLLIIAWPKQRVCACVAVYLCVCVKVWELNPQSALTGQRYFHPHFCIATQQQTTKSLLLPLLEQKVKYDPEPTFSRVQFPLTAALVCQDV